MKKVPVKFLAQECSAESILAKSDGKSLLRHIEDCLKVYQELKMALPILPSLSGMEDFFDLLFCTVYLHDWGKVHKEFQRVLKKQENKWLHNRHEIFSVPFVEMLPFTPEQKEIIALSILGHHKDFETLQEYLYSDKEVEEYRLNYKHQVNPLDFNENLQKCLNITYLLDLKAKLQDYYDRYASGKRQFEFEHVDFSSQKNPIQTYALSYLIKKTKPGDTKYWPRMFLSGATKICDHMGSAELLEIPRLTEKKFHFLNRLNGKWYTHQEECGRVKGNVFLAAPTGSGKTEAALLWLRKQLQSGRQGRIFYVLPYTASINAMHQRLARDFEGKGAKPGQTTYIGLLHGKLSQYLSEYFEDTEDSPKDLQVRLGKIKNMHRQMVHPLKVVTPFQILKYCYGVKGFEKGFTELAGAMLIFDEIHAYDVQTFAQIISSLKWLTKYLQIRVMIMTATLPSFMYKELQSAVGHSVLVKADHTLLEQFTRHRVQIAAGTIFDQLPVIKKMLRKKGKIIVVCNTVSNAQEVFRQLTENTEASKAVLLHSRFIAEHRMEKERLLFKDDIHLLVGTQAIEVSLDIDFDVLFTEPAPLDALIQRFGRINRKREKGICSVFICREGGKYDSYIYPEELVTRTLEVLSRISLIKEYSLQKMLDEVYPQWPDKNKYDETKAGFMESLSRLKPFMRHKEEEEAFYRRFTSVSVLPVEFREIFEEHIRQFDFIEAERLFVTVHKGMFYKLLNDGLVEREVVEIKQNNRIKSFPYWVVICQYNKQLGLLEKEAVTGNGNIIC